LHKVFSTQFGEWKAKVVRPAKSNAEKAHTGSKLRPELTPGAPLKPTGLSERAAVEWDRLSAELAESGIMVTVAHRAPLALAATIAADIAEAWAAVNKDGTYVEGKTGLQAHPAVKRMDALRRDYIKVLGMLGLRAAVSGEARTGGETLEDVLNGE
jgi:phage terminase small subunit